MIYWLCKLYTVKVRALQAITVIVAKDNITPPILANLVYTWMPLFSVFIINQGGLGAPLDPRPWTFSN